VTPAADQGLPRAAFDGVRVAAVLGTVAILHGVALVTGPVLALLRSGGWPRIRRPLVVATGISALTALVLLAVVTWAHHLSPAARNGSDVRYSLAFLAVVLCIVGTIAAWTVAAVAIAGQLALPSPTLRRETFLAGGVTLAMAAVTVAACTWWITVTASASGFGTGFPWLMVAIASVMVAATGLALAGSDRAIRAVRAAGRQSS
jgi:hypothetical protein